MTSFDSGAVGRHEPRNLDFSHSGGAADPAPPGQAARLAEQRELVAAARREAERTGDPQLAADADALEAAYHAQELAVLAAAVYHTDAVEGWTRVSADPALLAEFGIDAAQLRPADSDFRAEVFIPDPAVFGADAQPVLSFRGSVTQEDWTNNALQGLGQEAPHYSRAMELATAVNRSTGGGFEVTGHSLGGGLASAAAAVTGVDATLFNAAGLHANTAARFVEAQGGTVFDIEASTTTWQVQGDVLTEVQASAAELNPDVAQRLANALGFALGFADNRVVDAIADTSALDSLQPLTGVGAADLLGAPQASGTHVSLPAVEFQNGVAVPRPDYIPLGGDGGILQQIDPAAGLATQFTETLRVGSLPGQWASNAGNALDHALDVAGRAADSVISGAGDAVAAAATRGGEAADSVLDRVGGFFGDVARGAGNLVEGAVDRVGDAAGGLLRGAGNVAEAGLDSAGRLAGAAIEGIGRSADGALSRASNLPGLGFLDRAGDVVSGGTDALGGLTRGTLASVGDVIGHGGRAIGDAAEAGLGLVGDAAGWVGDRSGAAVEGAGDRLGDLAAGTSSAVAGAISQGGELLGRGTRSVLDGAGNAVAWGGDAVEVVGTLGATVNATVITAGSLLRQVVFEGSPLPADTGAIQASFGEMTTRHGMPTVEAGLSVRIAEQEAALQQRLGR